MIVKIGFFSSGTTEELENGKRIWENEMVPLLKKQKGFRKAFRATALDEPGGAMIQFWDSDKDEAAWRSGPEYLTVYRKMEPFIPELRIERDFELDLEI